jgi:hypothetical protein
MQREEAQNILQLCRPDNSEDRNDPLIAEALELLKQDAELRTWFDEQQALDAKIRNDLNRIEPPADLYAAILTGMRAHAAQSQLIGTKAEDAEQDQHTIRFTQPANRPDQRSGLRAWMAIAAIFAIAGVALMLPRSEAPTQLANNDQPAADASPIIATAGVPNMIEFLAQQISEFNSSKFDKRGEQVGELQSHLASTGMPNPAQIPKQLEQLTTIGCVTFDYDGTKLSMICFKNGQVYHLITVDKARVPVDCAPCQGQKSKVFEAQQQAFKVWAEGEQIFILTTQGSKEDLADFI